MITRFAPSPTGPLHLGHAYSAIVGFDMAMENGGQWLLRIEDIDGQRCKPEWEKQIYEDLEWLGLWWPEPVMRQSDRVGAYQTAIDSLKAKSLLYPCTCTRADILHALAAPQEGGSHPTGPDGVVYPGTCRPAYWFEPDFRSHPDAALRLNMLQAAGASEPRAGEAHAFWFQEDGHGPAGQRGFIDVLRRELIDSIGDVVIARRDIGTSYHLSVVLDDATQGITHVVRGQDLFEATKIHVVLQRLLSMPTPIYHHHRLIRDENGKRLAKRDGSRAIRLYRQEGATRQDIRRMIGL
jgi:glutamyl-Q tRNA(Asp) synthetase